jgi:hypothetical protein
MPLWGKLESKPELLRCNLLSPSGPLGHRIHLIHHILLGHHIHLSHQISSLSFQISFSATKSI